MKFSGPGRSNQEWLHRKILDYLEYCRAVDKSKNTIKSYTSDLNQFVKKMDSAHLDKISSGHIEAYLKSFNGREPATKRRKVETLSAFFNYCVEKEWIARNPVTKSMRPRVQKKEPRTFTPEQQKKIFSSTLNLTYWHMFYTMVSVGLRVSECLDLKIEDVNYEKGCIIVEGKGAKQRTVPPRGDRLPDRYMKDLKNYIGKRKTGNVFLNRDGDPFTSPHAVQRAFQVTLKKLGYVGNVHMLRATCLTKIYDISEKDILYVKDFAGHEDVNTTLRYIGQGKGHDLEAMEIYPE